AQAMARIGYQPHRLPTFTLGDATIMSALAGEAWEGVISSAYFPLPDQDPVVAAALERVAAREPSLRAMAYNALAGITFMEPLVEAFRRAGRNLTPESFVAAMESIKEWDGEVIRQVTFGPDRHQGINRIFLTQIQGGRAVPISDWIEYPVGF
ncbi:MAG TPA: ABC transporter substrate-binding protein, partial [Limnochorda sp.]